MPRLTPKSICAVQKTKKERIPTPKCLPSKVREERRGEELKEAGALCNMLQIRHTGSLLTLAGCFVERREIVTDTLGEKNRISDVWQV